MIALRALLFNTFFMAWTASLAVLYLLLLPFPWRVLFAAVTWSSQCAQPAALPMGLAAGVLED